MATDASEDDDLGSREYSSKLAYLDSPFAPSWRNCWGKPVGAYVAFVLLGIAPQLVQNMIFSQAPLMASYLPEGKALQAHIIACFMVANVITLLYLLLQFFKRTQDLWAMIIVLFLGVIDSAALSSVWDITMPMGKYQVSVPLLVCSFVAGAAGNTSTLIGFSFAARYKEMFVSALSAGFGLSGLIPSILNFIQDTGATYPTQPRFGPSVWFLSSGFLIIIFSLAIVYILSQTDIADPEQVRHTFEQEYKLLPGESSINEVGIPAKTSQKALRIGECLLMMLLTSFSTFLIPGSLPYLGESQRSLVWMNIVFLVVPTVGTAAAGLFRPFKRSRIVPWVLIGLQTLLFIYFFLVVLQKTRPQIYHKVPLLFVALVLFSILTGYNSTMVYLILRQEEVVEVAMVEQAQKWAGFTFQVGGFLGVMTNLIAVHSHLYHSS